VLPLRYPLRSLWVRRSRAALTVFVIALVVLAVALLSGLVTSLKASLAASGSPRNLIVLRKGASSDGASALPLEVYQTLRFFDGVATGPDGEPLVSPELVVQPFGTTRWGSRESAQVRGVEAPAFALRDEVSLRAGRRLRPSSGEAIVGSKAAARYAGAEPGGELLLGNARWRVVGVFESAGSALESEIWVDARQLANDVKRPSPYSSLRLRVADGADVSALIRRIESDPRFTLQAHVESEYYAKQAASADALYVVVGGLALLAGVGAAFGATNTLYAAVQARSREIGTLRALGFSRTAIASAFLLEAASIAVAGFALGAALATVAALAISALVGDVSTFAMDGTALVSLRVGALDLAAALALAIAIGLGGALAPALRAARLRPIEALRKG
jgi:putative ABC transport system permease protein